MFWYNPLFEAIGCNFAEKKWLRINSDNNKYLSLTFIIHDILNDIRWQYSCTIRYKAFTIFAFIDYDLKADLTQLLRLD